MENKYSFTATESKESILEWVCYCNEYPCIALSWVIHKFNDTQKMVNEYPVTDDVPFEDIPRIMREMGEFLREHYYNLIF